MSKKYNNKFSNFHFKHIDLSNDLYKKSGEDASTFIFPFQNNFFDIGISVSVFTHMLPEEVVNYFSEMNRKLGNEGYFVASFFLIDDENDKPLKFGSKSFNFKYKYGDSCLLMDDKVKSANVAYLYSFIKSLIYTNNFVIEKEIKGFWTTGIRNNRRQFQDILILKKKSKPTLILKPKKTI